MTYVTDALRVLVQDEDMLKWLPIVDPEACTGCGLCAAACGPLCLEMVGEYPILTNAAACGSEEHCIGVCESDAIRMAWVSLEGDTLRGKWCSGASATGCHPLGLHEVNA